MSNDKQINRLLKKVRRLKQRDEYWEGTSRLGRMWITRRNNPPYRPNVILLVSQEDKVLRTRVLEAAPTSDQLFEELLRAMHRPTWGAGGARRPKVIYLDNPDYVTALAPRLATLDVRCQHRRSLPIIEEALYSMEMRMNRGQEPIPGLVAIPSVTPPLIGHLFELAADFYRATPWQWLTDSHPMEIRYPPDKNPRYAVVMGSGGEVFGLAVYDTLADLQLMYRADLSPQQTTKRATWSVLFFEEATAMSFDDLEAMDKYDWPVAAEQAYPVFGRTTPAGELVQPTKADVFWMEGALAGILAYYLQAKETFGPAKGVRQSGVPPAEVTLSVATISGEAQVYLRLPAFD